MRIGVDAQLALGTATGIGEYISGLCAALETLGLDVVSLQNAGIDPWRFDRRVLWDQVFLPVAVSRARIDVLHCAAGTMPLVSNVPMVCTVHDVAWLRAQAHTRAYARWYFGTFSLGRYRKARQIAVDSEFSRSELVHFTQLPFERVHVIYPGVDRSYMALSRARSETPFILAVGTVERRKNLEILVRALPKLAPEIQLVACGPSTPYESECKALAQRLGVTTRINWLGYVTRQKLLELFASAWVVAVPSRYEGFGYAAAQALCAGAPLVVSNCSSLPEIVARSAPALDPDDLDAWVGALTSRLDAPNEHESHAGRLRADAAVRFSWYASARKMEAIYTLVNG